MNEKKQQIINAARDLFTKYGYKKVSMDEIASAAGVTKKTIYAYFKDKNALLKYFIQEEVDNMQKITNSIKEENLPFVETIHKMIYNLLNYRKKEALLVLLAKDKDTIIAKECLDILNNTILSEIKDTLEKAIKDGYIRDCNIEMTSFIIYKIYVALIFEWDKPFDSEEVTSGLINFMKSGLLK